MNNVKIRVPNPPAELLTSLEKLASRYANCVTLTLFHFVWLHGNNYVGVVGDGENGWYEWFVFQADDLRTSLKKSDQAIVGGTITASDMCYGSTVAALRDVLNREEPKDAHDDYVTKTVTVRV